MAILRIGSRLFDCKPVEKLKNWAFYGYTVNHYGQKLCNIFEVDTPVKSL